MISFLEGEVVEKGANRIVLAVGGVGYDLLVPTSVVSKLPPTGKTTRVHTRMVVRDDAMVLYGFSATDERELFDLLTGVSGVGPKVALSFLSALAPDALRRSVVAGDAEALTVVPGVGKKVAQRVVLDLRDKTGRRGRTRGRRPDRRCARGVGVVGSHPGRSERGPGVRAGRRPRGRGSVAGSPAEGGPLTWTTTA